MNKPPTIKLITLQPRQSLNNQARPPTPPPSSLPPPSSSQFFPSQTQPFYQIPTNSVPASPVSFSLNEAMIVIQQLR